MAPPRVRVARGRNGEQQNAGNENDTPQHGTVLKLRIEKMRVQIGRIKAANVHNRAFISENLAITFGVIARLDRAIQYSRDGCA